MIGNSGVSVWVRSTTRTAPAAMAFAKSSGLIIDAVLSSKFALPRLRIDGETGTHILSDLAHEHVLGALSQRTDDRARQSGRRYLGRWHCFKPFGLERAEEDVHDFYTARTQFGPHRLRRGQ